MLDVNALPFISAIAALRSLIERARQCPSTNEVSADDVKDTLELLKPLRETFDIVGSRSAKVANDRLIEVLSNASINYGQLLGAATDVESRFADHLGDVKFFVMQPAEASLMLPVDQLLASVGAQVEGFPNAFPKASFEIEEAAKCLALNRDTAAVFHCMRSLESGIRAFAKLLKVPDPIKASQKNWGAMLDQIKSALDERWPRQKRLSGTAGSEYEKIYATLDAVRNPWRNATMHVESIYPPHEALHIARCTAMFLIELAKHCDEEGRSGKDAPALAEVVAANVTDEKVELP